MKHSQLRKLVLNENDAEFLIQRIRNGTFKIRIGQVWKVSKLRGTTTILCDYDNCKAIDIGNIARRLHTAGVSIVRIISHRSPSESGWHLVIFVRGHFNRWQRICLQAICESDPEREAKNFRRATLKHPLWRDDWQVLFK